MVVERLTLVRAGSLAKRELRSVGTWALACGFLAYALWSTWPGSPSLSAGLGSGVAYSGFRSLSSWIGVLAMILSLLLPLWIIERLTTDHSSRWFEPLFVAGWSRESYLLSLFSVIVGLGLACLLASVLPAWVFCLTSGGAMPNDAASSLVAGIPTCLACAAGGLLLATLFLDRAMAISVALLGIAIPVLVSAIYVLNVDRLPPEPVRTLLSIHLPPVRPDPSAPWFLYKLAYASVAVWLSLFLADRRIGNRV
jgi:hypothetical protein